MGASLVGILPVLPTPFDEAGQVDLAGLRRVVSFALRAGVTGLVYPGFASEVDSLQPGERGIALRHVVEAADGRVPVVAGASAPSLAEAIVHARDAQRLGIAHVMIQAPKGVGADAAGVAAFYGAVAEAVPDLDVVLQNAPAPRGSDLAPATILDVVRAVPAITYVKEESVPAGGAITAILKARPPHLKGVLGGGGARHILDEYGRGACGAMPAVEIADVHVALDRAYRTGDIGRARDLYERTLPLLVMQANFRMGLTKHVLVRRGVLMNRLCRAPGPPMDDLDLAEIDAWLARMGDLLDDVR